MEKDEEENSDNQEEIWNPSTTIAKKVKKEKETKEQKDNPMNALAKK